jgi:alanyl-tRNA synthetase
MISRKKFEELKKKEKILRAATKILRVREEDLPRVIKRFKKEVREMEKKLAIQ